jgi:hypothetical protein
MLENYEQLDLEANNRIALFSPGYKAGILLFKLIGPLIRVGFRIRSAG